MGGEPQHGLIEAGEPGLSEADRPGPAAAPVTDAPGRTHGRRHRRRRAAGPFPPSPWVTATAFAIVIVPFAFALGRLVTSPGQHLYLPDDLALIDLHTRQALAWKQQLGVFDHNGWNHPGPAYFYLLSLAYRVLGSGAKAMFVGATLVNATAAVCCVAVVRRRASPARALWAGFWVCVLGSVVAVVGPGSVTYSEGALGGLVSPWNPMVVIFPLLLFVLLCAGAVDRSPLSLIGAVLVGSFVVQTNISALVLVVALLLLSAVAWAWTAASDRRQRGPGTVPDDRTAVHPSDANGGRGPVRGRLWGIAGLVLLVAMWVPPLVQQLTNHPGNLTLIARFFFARHPTPSATASLRAVVSVYGVLVVGPSEIMSSYLGHTPHHVVAAVAATSVALLAGAVATVVGVRQHNRFAAGLGALSLVGFVAMVLAVSHIVGEVYGYLVVWAVAVPVAGLIGVGMLRPPTATAAPGRQPVTSLPAVRLAACLAGVAASVLLCWRVAALPALDRVSDPQVGQLTSLVTPSLTGSPSVFVNDSGAGATTTARLLDVEKFIGLVNQLDERGDHPKVNHLWRAQFGPGFAATGTERRAVELRTWTPASPGSPGYLGRVGDLSVTVTRSEGRSTDPADSPG